MVIEERRTAAIEVTRTPMRYDARARHDHYAPYAREAIQARVFAIRRRTHISIAGHAIFAAADPRVISVGRHLDELTVIAGDMGCEIIPLTDA